MAPLVPRCLLPLFFKIGGCQPRHKGAYYLCSSRLLDASLGTQVPITYVLQDCSVLTSLPRPGVVGVNIPGMDELLSIETLTWFSIGRMVVIVGIDVLGCVKLLPC